MRARHILRLLAILIVAAALFYAGKILRADVISSHAQKTADLLGVLPLLAFGVVLWWYSGRNVGELSNPLFRSRTAGEDEMRMGARNAFLAGTSVIAIFAGLCTMVFGAILAVKRDLLERAFPALEQVSLAPRSFLIFGGILVVLGGLALGLARNGAWVAICLLAGFLGMCGVAFGATMAWHRDVMLTAFPIMQRMNFSAPTIFLLSGGLLAMAALALGLAVRSKTPKA